MYPCAGKDFVEPFTAFADQFDTALFVDIGYQFNQFETPKFDGWRAVEGTLSVEGPPTDRVRRVAKHGHSFREVVPAWWRCRYQKIESRKTVELVLRRGFGQYALRELNTGQLGMFLHRGDSSGEGGSGTQFFANHRMDHEPLSMLLDVIKTKLSVPAWIGSDGSNTPIRELTGAAAGTEGHSEFSRHGLLWRRAQTLPWRLNRATVLWQVTPLQPLISTGQPGTCPSAGGH